MIRYYEGVEGSGKTCMMTRDLYRHKMYGGRVLALPGYELFGRSKKSVLSELIMPEQLWEMLQTDDTELIRKQRIAIAMDEVTNFFNNHSWQSKINDILEILFAERRKLGVAALMTGPEQERLPSNVRFLIHEMVHCQNAHSFNRDIPAGMMCSYYKEDRRGMLSHPRFRFSKKRKFYMSKWHKHFDTHAAVGYQQNLRVIIPKREVIFGEDGKPISVEDSNNQVEQNYYDERVDIASKVEELRSLGITELKGYEFASILEELSLPNNKRIKGLFNARGVFYNPQIQGYSVIKRDTLQVG